jgi:DNA-binding response OmpR family regulator
LEKLESDASFDLIMLDGNLCLTDGTELTKIIRQRWPQTSLLVLTNIKEQGLNKEAGTSGAGNYLIKPFSLKKLHDAIMLVLNANPKEATVHF